MKCPNDGATLVMTDRSGVEIDYCPECRGVWLDRGELDKIIDRAGAMSASTPSAAPTPPPAAPFPPREQSYGYGRDGYGRDGYGHDGYRRKKKDNWLSELFD